MSDLDRTLGAFRRRYRRFWGPRLERVVVRSFALREELGRILAEGPALPGMERLYWALSRFLEKAEDE